MSSAFQCFTEKKAVLWLDPEFANQGELLQLLDPSALAERFAGHTAGPRGRAATAILPLADRPEQILLRPVRHGGWLAPLWGDRIAGLARPRAEGEVTAALHAAGAPVPRAALVLGHRRGLLWSATIGTVYEAGTVDGAAFLAREPGQRDSLRAARAAARAIRRFHDAGGQHPDLHIGNLIVRDADGRTQVLIVDLDRARRAGGAPSPEQRMRELMRLYRSLRKHSLLGSLGKQAVIAFLDAYVAGDVALRAALLRQLPREQRRIARHAATWRTTAP